MVNKADQDNQLYRSSVSFDPRVPDQTELDHALLEERYRREREDEAALVRSNITEAMSASSRSAA